MKQPKNIFFILIFLSSSLFAQSLKEKCQKEAQKRNIDLSHQLGPIRNQDSVGFCHTYTNADLLTQYLEKNKAQLGYENIDFSKKENNISGMALGFKHLRADYYAQSLVMNHYHQTLKPEEKTYENIYKYIDEQITGFKKEIKKLEDQITLKNPQIKGYRDEAKILYKRSKQDGKVIDPISFEKSKDLSQKINHFFYINPKLRELEDKRLKLSLYKFKLEEKEENKEPFPEKFEPIREGGYSTHPLRIALASQSLCLEKHIQSDDFKYSKLYHEIQHKIPKFFLEELYKEKSPQPNPSNPLCPDKTLYAMTSLFPQSKLDNIKNILSEIKKDNDFIGSLIKNSGCDFKIPKEKIPIVKFSHKSYNVMDQIDEALEQGSIAGIGWNPDILESLKPVTNKNGHASSIVGRKIKCQKDGSQKIYYKLRNSWGEESCENNVKYFPYFNKGKKAPFHCDQQGYHFMPKDYLEKAIGDTHYIKNP